MTAASDDDEADAAAIRARIAALDWTALAAALERGGFATIDGLLDGAQCARFAARYESGRFRSRIDMGRHRFGQGEYKYFDRPLPAPVAMLRREFYARLAPVARDWQRRLATQAAPLPDTLEAFLARCHEAGQTRPTPLLLRYGPGDYNCLHQDLYGAHVFPLQLAILLDAPDVDFTGGEFVLVEQRPRAQSKAEVVPLARGSGVVFAVSRFPRRGLRGDHALTLRHAVSPIRTGRRHTLGVIFHDAA